MLWPLIVYFVLVVILVGVMLALSAVLGERHRQRETGLPFGQTVQNVLMPGVRGAAREGGGGRARPSGSGSSCRGWPSTLVWAVMFALAGLGLVAAPECGAQATRPQRRFAVVSIKPDPPGSRWRTPAWQAPGPVRPGGRYVDPEATPCNLIRFAYPSSAKLGKTLLGIPAALCYRPIYYFQAEPGPGPAPTRDQMRLMMRTVLARRFGLRFHMAKRVEPVYFLRLATGGPRNLTPVDPAREPNSLWSLVGWTHVFIVADAISVPELAAYCYSRPTIDQTGLKGYYNINFPPVEERNPARGVPRLSVNSLMLKFFRQELGIDAVPGVASVNVMIVDSIHAPTAN